MGTKPLGSGSADYNVVVAPELKAVGLKAEGLRNLGMPLFPFFIHRYDLLSSLIPRRDLQRVAQEFVREPQPPTPISYLLSPISQSPHYLTATHKTIWLPI